MNVLVALAIPVIVENAAAGVLAAALVGYLLVALLNPEHWS